MLFEKFVSVAPPPQMTQGPTSLFFIFIFLNAWISSGKPTKSQWPFTSYSWMVFYRTIQHTTIIIKCHIQYQSNPPSYTQTFSVCDPAPTIVPCHVFLFRSAFVMRPFFSSSSSFITSPQKLCRSLFLHIQIGGWGGGEKRKLPPTFIRFFMIFFFSLWLPKKLWFDPRDR